MDCVCGVGVDEYYCKEGILRGVWGVGYVLRRGNTACVGMGGGGKGLSNRMQSADIFLITCSANRRLATLPDICITDEKLASVVTKSEDES